MLRILRKVSAALYARPNTTCIIINLLFWYTYLCRLEQTLHLNLPAKFRQWVQPQVLFYSYRPKYPRMLPHPLAYLCILIPGGPNKNGTVNFLGLCSDQQLSFFTLLDRAPFPHYNNTKIIKFGWKLFILWLISYGLSFSGFAINLSLIVPRNSGNWANPENDSP